MDVKRNGLLPVVNRMYEVTYKNEYDQADVLYGLLVHPDLNGFVVFSKDDKRVIIPKDRIFILREADTPTSEEGTAKEQSDTAKKGSGPA